MNILGLWINNYHSGSTSERFVSPLNALGHKVDVIPLESKGVESFLINRANNYDLLVHLPYLASIRLEIIKHLPIATVAWNGDDEWFWHKHRNLARTIADSHDFCVTTHRPSLRYYDNGILGQWGYGPEWKRRKTKKKIDLYFCGSRTPYRDQCLRHLRDEGLSVVIDGPGYSGKVPLETMIERYRQAKIGLNFNFDQKDDFPYYQVKARTFEIPAVSTFQICDYHPALLDFFNSDQAGIFKTPGEMVRLAKHYLAHDHARDTASQAAHERNKGNSYESIFKRVLAEIESKKSVPVLDA